MLRAQAAEDTTALTPEEAAHIINTERTMLMDLLASVGKDCSILQRMVQEEEEDANMQQMEDDVVVEQEVDVAMEDAAAPAEGVDAVPPVERAATPGALPSPPHALLNVHDGVALDSNPGYGVLDGWLGERNTSSMLVRCKLCSKTRVVPNEEYVAFLQRHMTREVCPSVCQTTLWQQYATPPCTTTTGYPQRCHCTNTMGMVVGCAALVLPRQQPTPHVWQGRLLPLRVQLGLEHVAMAQPHWLLQAV